MIKRNLGSAMRSFTIGRRHELLLRVLTHNIMLLAEVETEPECPLFFSLRSCRAGERISIQRPAGHRAALKSETIRPVSPLQ